MSIPKTSIGRILKQLNLKAYRPRLTNKLEDGDHDRRCEFSEKFIELTLNFENLQRKVIWSDEASFSLCGTVNRHNSVYYRTENPHIKYEVNQFSKKIMVWLGVTYDGIIGPYFFEENVNGKTYLDMLQNYMVPIIETRSNFHELWYQHVDAPAHYSKDVSIFLDQIFSNRWIGRRGPIEWPPRSPDLNPLDFFVWGYLKDKVFAHTPSSIFELCCSISFEVLNIPLEFIQNAVDSVISRLLVFKNNEGQTINHEIEN